MQHGDFVLYQGERFHLLRSSTLDEGSARDFKVNPRVVSANCPRGFYRTYTVTDTLSLAYLHIGLSKEDERKAHEGTGPIIYDTLPKTYFNEVHHYDLTTRQWKTRIERSPYWLYDVEQPLETDGFIRMGKGSIQKGLAYRDALGEDWIHDTIYNIELKAGRVVRVMDRSDEEKQAYGIPLRKPLKTLAMWLRKHLDHIREKQ